MDSTVLPQKTIISNETSYQSLSTAKLSTTLSFTLLTKLKLRRRWHHL